MIEFPTSIAEAATAEQLAVQAAVTALILVAGYVLTRLAVSVGDDLIIRLSDADRKVVEKRRDRLEYLRYILNGVVILLALLYLNATVTEKFFEQTVESFPEIVSVILLGVLGVLAINFSIRFVRDALRFLKIETYFEELGLSSQIADVLEIGLKIVLYLLLLQIILTQVGIGEGFASDLVTASAYGLVLITVISIFWISKDLLKDYGAGIYLRNSRDINEGEEVRIGDKIGRIKDIRPLNTFLETDEGYKVIKSNSEMLKDDIKLKEARSDLETLEDIKEYFTPGENGGPEAATVEMCLDILGYRTSQEQIQELLEDGGMEESIEEITDGKVGTGFVELEKAGELDDELKSWFNDGGMAIVKLDREEISGGLEGETTALAVGVEGGDILMVSPEREVGGVYYMDSGKLEKSLKSTENPGYTVVAPESTKAHWRIKKNLMYTDRRHYEDLSKTLENRLERIARQGRIMKNAIPAQVQEYIDRWKEGGTGISKLWRTGERGSESEDS